MEPDNTASLYRISTIVNRADDPRAAIRMFADELALRFQPAYIAVTLLNPDSEAIEFEFAQGSGIDRESVGSPVPEPSIARWVALHGKALEISGFPNERRFLPLVSGCPAEMAAPLTGRTSPFGSVLLGANGVTDFSQADTEELSLMAAEASWVIEKLWEIEQLQLQSAQLQSLISIGQRLVSTLELNDLLESITSEARSIMRCRLCALFLLSEDGRILDLQAVAGTGKHDGYRELLSLEDSAIGTAIARRKEIEVSNLAKSEEHHFVSIVRQEGLVSLLSVPIFFENQSIGVLNAYTDRRHRFTNHEKSVLAALASLSAVAIQNVRLYGRVFKSEETLRDNERLTTLGLLAAEIAHEIRNPLTVIRLLFDSLDLKFDSGDARRKDTEVIVEEITHLEEIVNRVLSFGKTGDSIHSHCEIDTLVRDTLHLLRLKLEQSRIRTEVITADRALVVEGHKGQLQQVILNLVINAMQAMPDGGEIKVEITRETHRDGDTAAILITDTGTGIPKSLRQSIFDSFLSGRSDGSGLGLAIAKRILKSHRGDIALVDSSRRGTTVRFWLPLAAPEQGR